MSKKHSSKGLLLTGAIAAAAAGVYLAGAAYFSPRFLPGSQLDGMDISGKTPQQVQEMVQANADTYNTVVHFRSGENEMIRATDIDYTVDALENITYLMQGQSPWKWPGAFFTKDTFSLDVTPSYNHEKLENRVRSMPALQEENMKEPVNASIYYDDEAGEFRIHEGGPGTTADADAVIAAVQKGIDETASTIDLEKESGIYKEQEITKDSQELTGRQAALNKYMESSVTFTLPSENTMTLDKSTTKSWLAKNDQGEKYFDEDTWNENIALYVDALAVETNTYGRTRTFDSTSRGQVQVPGTTYGNILDKDAEKEKIKEDLQSGEAITREPVYSVRESDRGHDKNDGIGDTYIEASISQQHAWIYKDGQCVMETDFVSGNTSQGHDTPIGVFRIQYKATNVDLKGKKLPDGSYSYVSHVNYWMPFYDGCGFHDASWRSSFGGSIYRSKGSHGCINLPPSITSEFFSYVEDNMPVVVY